MRVKLSPHVSTATRLIQVGGVNLQSVDVRSLPARADVVHHFWACESFTRWLKQQNRKEVRK